MKKKISMKSTTNQSKGMNSAVSKRQGKERPKLKKHRGRKAF